MNHSGREEGDYSSCDQHPARNTPEIGIRRLEDGYACCGQRHPDPNRTVGMGRSPTRVSRG